MRMSALRRCRALLRDRRGVTVVEFAIVAPVMGLVLLGGFDIGHTLYMRTTLQGVLQKAGRDAALESGASASAQEKLDKKITDQVKALANNADVEIKRRYYRTFEDAAAAKAEIHTEVNGNGICDAGEPFEDANNNGKWDADGGNGGQGGAKDATLYTVTVSYPRFFPLNNFIGGSNTTKVSASTVLRNQPYADQGVYDSPTEGHCP
ncbi:Flp pilus assembly protein TadG [Sphingomonas naasensis]|uniref:Tight adherence protein TadE n=1 Tax=Sphingomonas naasensis TaxID=1344951 RepID=A0A4S1WW05_9SPHN|nr:TadE/TadG family type IV pilus assembly protein [Sphingomonas naasensis]NIJ18523.1 Flp pilus assembly protein TadG [Sphingomonas naasensis]TGX45776.1 tight adherence protein TadE [Sphingomonas naasensis]